MSFVFVTCDIYDIYIFFFFGNGLIDDVIVIGWTDSDFKISRALMTPKVPVLTVPEVLMQ